MQLDSSTPLSATNDPSPPLVSIITPCYRQADFLSQAIDSVLAQSYPAVELLVVNDGSDDGTENVARSYGRRVRYVWQKNAGVAAARNAGIHAATGRYLLFLDADDALHPEAVAWHMEALQGEQNAISVQGYRRFRDDPFDPDQPDQLPPDNFTASLPLIFMSDPVLSQPLCSLPASRHSLLPYLIHSTFGPPHCFLAPKAAVSKVGGFDERRAGCADWDLWLRLALEGIEVVTVPRAGAYYRRHAGSVSTHSLAMLRDRTAVLLQAHNRIIGQRALLRKWGPDLMKAETHTRRRYLARGLPRREVRELSTRINELHLLEVPPQAQSLDWIEGWLPLRLCRGTRHTRRLSGWLERRFHHQMDVAEMALFRLLRRRVFSYYASLEE